MKNVFITGINRGLGKALFQLFISKGYHVFGVLRNEQTAEELKKDLPKNAQLILADLSADTSLEAIQVSVEGQSIDLLINNAGIGGYALKLGEVESEELLKLFNIHCLGVFRTTKALIPNLLKAKAPLVLNLNSRFGSITRQSLGTYDKLGISYSYRISKAAQNMLTNCLRVEFKEKIKFISIHPGRMKTDIAQTDADLEPETIAKKFLTYYENGKFTTENGIIELDREIIAW